MQIYTRIGYISCIDDNTKKVSVTYSNSDNATTTMFPFLSFNNEYQRPQIDDKVVVLYITKSSAIVLGGILSEEEISKDIIYRKDFDSRCSGDYFEQIESNKYKKKINDFSVNYNNISKELEINVGKIILKTGKNIYEL